VVALFPADVIDSFTDLVRVAGTSPATTAGCGSKRSNRFADTIAAPKRGEHRETWNGRQGRKRLFKICLLCWSTAICIGASRPNFTHSQAKLLIFLHTAPFCSYNNFLIFDLTLAWVRESFESTETKSTLEHRTLHTRKPLPKIVVSTRLDNRVIRIAYVVSG